MKRDRLAEVSNKLAQLQSMLEAIDQRLQATQALTARVYEQGLGWEQQLNEMRADPQYQSAFKEAHPLISVRICTWNKAELLVGRALPSLLRQTHANWEAIVVGDACTDDTAERIAALGDPRISFENLDVRGPYPDLPGQLWQVAGVYAARRAYQRATGQWIAQLDDDDEWNDDHLEVLLGEATRSGAEVVYGKWRWVDAASGKQLGSFGSWPPKLGEITWQAAIEHGHMRRFLPDPNAHLADEPGDWHRARRLLDVGVRFGFIEREVATIYLSLKTEGHQALLDSIDKYRSTAT